MPEMTAPPHLRRRRLAGFTLIELAIVLVIAALLVRVATPGMSRPVAARALAAQASEFMAALRFARSEAMKRGGPVIMCRLQPPATGHCAQGGGDWGAWMVFADADRSGAYEAGEPLVSSHLEPSNRLSVSAVVPGVTFEATGIARSTADGGKVVFLLSPGARASAGTAAGDRASQRQVCVNPRGEVAVIDGNGSCP